jgi:hypothetical protein
LSYYVPGQKPGGGATGHAKWVGWRRDPIFDDYTQNSSDFNLNSKINLKITVELKMFSHHVKFRLN